MSEPSESSKNKEVWKTILAFLVIYGIGTKTGWLGLTTPQNPSLGIIVATIVGMFIGNFLKKL